MIKYNYGNSVETPRVSIQKWNATMRTNDATPAPQAVKNAVELLDRDTAKTLRTLWEAPLRLAPHTIERIPFGSRMALIDLGIVTDDYQLTTFGCYVIDYIATRPGRR